MTPDGSQPSDQREEAPTCVLEGLAKSLGVHCDVAIVVANIIGFGLLAIILLLAFVIVKRR